MNGNIITVENFNSWPLAISLGCLDHMAIYYMSKHLSERLLCHIQTERLMLKLFVINVFRTCDLLVQSRLGQFVV